MASKSAKCVHYFYHFAVIFQKITFFTFLNTFFLKGVDGKHSMETEQMKCLEKLADASKVRNFLRKFVCYKL